MTRPGHPELAEHVATYAAERGDTELEQLCDDVLAGLTEEALLLAVVSGDPEVQEAVERGRNAGWRSRRGVQDAFERATMAITGRPYAEVAAETAPDPAPAPAVEGIERGPKAFAAALSSPAMDRAADELAIAFIAGASWASNRLRMHDEMRAVGDEYGRVHLEKAAERGVTITIMTSYPELEEILRSKKEAR